VPNTGRGGDEAGSGATRAWKERVGGSLRGGHHSHHSHHRRREGGSPPHIVRGGGRNRRSELGLGLGLWLSELPRAACDMRNECFMNVGDAGSMDRDIDGNRVWRAVDCNGSDTHTEMGEASNRQERYDSACAMVNA